MWMGQEEEEYRVFAAKWLRSWQQGGGKRSIIQAVLVEVYAFGSEQHCPSLFSKRTCGEIPSDGEEQKSEHPFCRCLGCSVAAQIGSFIRAPNGEGTSRSSIRE